VTVNLPKCVKFEKVRFPVQKTFTDPTGTLRVTCGQFMATGSTFHKAARKRGSVQCCRCIPAWRYLYWSAAVRL